MVKQTKKQESITKNNGAVVCPKCGTELDIVVQQQQPIVVGVMIEGGRIDSVCPVSLNESIEQPKAKRSAQERIDALKAAGVEVSNLFAITGATGGDYICRNENGNLSLVNDDDPIFQYIIDNGTIPNRKLFRRWVMAQMFRMMTEKECCYFRKSRLIGVTEAIHRLGYEYTWKMIINELYAQVKMMENGDLVNLMDRKRWFTQEVVVSMANHYIDMLKKHIDNKPTRKCKGMPYKTIAGQNVFVEDLQKKIYNPYVTLLHRIQTAKSTKELYAATVAFNKKRIKLGWDTPQCPQWLDAYKGSGAYFTLQNMIRFHKCHIVDDAGQKLNKELSLTFIQEKAKMYANGEGWRMLGVLKKCLKDNNVDIEKKMAEWRKK